QVYHCPAVRLVRTFVTAEPDVAIRAKDLSGAEFRFELGQQRQHRAADLLVVDGLVVGPVGLRIVCRQALVEVDRVVAEPLETHCRMLATLRLARRPAPALCAPQAIRVLPGRGAPPSGRPPLR